MIHLTENPKKMVKEVLRILKPGGNAIISVLSDYKDSSFFYEFKDLLKKYGRPNDTERSMFHLGSEEALRELCFDFDILGFERFNEKFKIMDCTAKVNEFIFLNFRICWIHQRNRNF